MKIYYVMCATKLRTKCAEHFVWLFHQKRIRSGRWPIVLSTTTSQSGDLCSFPSSLSSGHTKEFKN